MAVTEDGNHLAHDLVFQERMVEVSNRVAARDVSIPPLAGQPVHHQWPLIA
jgi:hypothetical protein